MTRKRWTPRTDITPSLLKFREKRKWQRALRRYVIDEDFCTSYAPYFGLDIKSLRTWFEMQFNDGMGWDDFGKSWQFDHLIPVAYFNYSIDEELKLCWNFTNLRVELFQLNKNRGHRLDVLAAKAYFEELYKTTQYPLCFKMLDKINELELSEMISTSQQQIFIRDRLQYLTAIENYSSIEFELLNMGRSIEDVEKEIQFLKKFKN